MTLMSDVRRAGTPTRRDRGKPVGHHGVMGVRVEVSPALLRWACKRSRVDADDLRRRFPKLADWEQGTGQPTLKQLEAFAKATRTPIGYLFLDEPPEDRVPIRDFRTIAGTEVRMPTPDLLDTIYLCQQRQEWFQAYAALNGEPQPEFVDSLTTAATPAESARAMARMLGFSTGNRGSTFDEAFRLLREGAEEAGVLVMVNGIVGSNTHRKLDPDEFRGFALVDKTAPLAFVNGADTKAAQIFTLAHELAHIWLGETGVSSVDIREDQTSDVEQWCNQTAAEFLAPSDEMHKHYRPRGDMTEELERLARHFKISTLTVLRRLYELAYLSRSDFWSAFDQERDRVLELVAQRQKSSGGEFYNTTLARVGKRFAGAVVTNTLEGRTAYSEAFSLLGFKKTATFDELVSRVGLQ